jgi:hypothetical protein
VRYWIVRVLLICAQAWIGQVHASGADQVINQCVAADGSRVYTDRSCASMDSVERVPRRRPGRSAGCIRPDGGRCPGRATAGAHALRLGCPARSPEGLRLAVGDALGRGDFNALAGLYNFANHSGQRSAAVVRRLLRIAKRTASHVALVEPAIIYDHHDQALPATAAEPVLRVVQYLSGVTGPLTSDDFHLVRAAGCLWLGS